MVVCSAMIPSNVVLSPVTSQRLCGLNVEYHRPPKAPVLYLSCLSCSFNAGANDLRGYGEMTIVHWSPAS
jgi:hypothetical protein